MIGRPLVYEHRATPKKGTPQKMPSPRTISKPSSMSACALGSLFLRSSIHSRLIICGEKNHMTYNHCKCAVDMEINQFKEHYSASIVTVSFFFLKKLCLSISVTYTLVKRKTKQEPPALPPQHIPFVSCSGFVNFGTLI